MCGAGRNEYRTDEQGISNVEGKEYRTDEQGISNVEVSAMVEMGNTNGKIWNE